MKILGIETSCDDTGIAIIEIQGKNKPSFSVLANGVSSQIKIHRPYGGVYPNLAKREHQKNLPTVLKAALRKAKLSAKTPGIGAIALTYGPGLDPCLWTGIEFAKKKAKEWGIPIIPVNHMEGHLLVSLFSKGKSFAMPRTKTVLPAISLIVSGGHTEIVLMAGIGRYAILGETLDDAAGECFDKTARILGLSYPGGPVIAKLAEETCLRNRGVRARRRFLEPKLPRPMINARNYDFSFSGLKTAVLYDWQSRTDRVRKSDAYVKAMAKEIQQAIIDILLSKTVRAAQEYDAKSVILGGGVAANQELRTQLKCKLFKEKPGALLFMAPPGLCTDNGLMVALAGFAHYKERTKNFRTIGSEPNLRLE
ncbi:MAG: tRNA (adenosine(37)-N6)-threonylcarbamoyltransferase complex transferase subunit TsaD [Candidatus Wildermuthbacteria bacterium]|nr:tRNA (adenosine(37)-N6)-threonylcarbamoyltransferase complex transferase subunit TsaD [Candidatus Wildermuthbacteria bacterium]